MASIREGSIDVVLFHFWAIQPWKPAATAYIIRHLTHTSFPNQYLTYSESIYNLLLPTTAKLKHPKLLRNPPKPSTTMSTDRCQQILAEVDNDVTMAVYRIFSEAQINDNITAKNWEDFTAGLDDGDKRMVDEVVCNLTHAWVQCAPCANLVALVRWRRDARGLVAQV